MLHSALYTLVLNTLSTETALAPHISADGAVMIRFEGGLFGPGALEVRCPEGLENDVAQAVQSLDCVARIPVFVGVAVQGQPTGLSRTETRLRVDPVTITPGLVRAPFLLEMGW